MKMLDGDKDFILENKFNIIYYSINITNINQKDNFYLIYLIYLIYFITPNL